LSIVSIAPIVSIVSIASIASIVSQRKRPLGAMSKWPRSLVYTTIVKSLIYFLLAKYLSIASAVLRPEAMARTTRLAPEAASPATKTLSANSGC